MKPSLISSLGYVRVAACAPRVSLADVEANVEEIKRVASDVHQKGAEVAVFPELCLSGYTCSDVFRQTTLLDACLRGLESLRHYSTNLQLLMVVGLPLQWRGKLYNVAAVVNDGQVVAVVPKTFLPNSREYYDQRWFASGAAIVDESIHIHGSEVPFGTNILVQDALREHVTIGIEICEDLWSVEPPSGDLSRQGATLILNCSASNEIVGKASYRTSLVQTQSARTYTAYAFASAGPTESTTDVVYSGHCLVAECGELVAQGQRFALAGSSTIADVDLQKCVRERYGSTSFLQEHSASDMLRVVTRIHATSKKEILRRIDATPFIPSGSDDRAERCQEIMLIQSTGLAVRLQRAKASTLVIGLSGGLDSTLAALVCVKSCELLGMAPTSILAVSMPGSGTTERTFSNAQALAGALGLTYRSIPIENAVQSHFDDIGHDASVTNTVFENAQARERTQILMDLANMHGGIVVGTGDLSEIALGWSTYNADHMSMYNPNAGVPKTLVQHLIDWYADQASDDVARILRDILDTPISPELLPTNEHGEQLQRTEDVIGPYEVHDFFLYRFVRLQEPVRQIAILACIAFAPRYSPEQILGWFGLFLSRFMVNQFKRSCMPDGVKVGSVALSPRADWRMPSDMSAATWLRELQSIKEEIGLF